MAMEEAPALNREVHINCIRQLHVYGLQLITRMDQVGRYRIQSEIGRGAMGVVYRALDPAIGRTVAIKTIRISELADSTEQVKLRERLFREAQSAGILSHPGIVTIYDVGEQDDTAYIAMELVDGPTLEKLMRSAVPDGQAVLSVLHQTAAALDYAHRRGIVHRDIKPANIILHENKTAKITDFGVAKIQSHQLTQAGSMVGTPNYMSPEQIQGQAVDGRSDQFSLAVIAYELLTGEKPFAGESIAALAFRIVKEDPAPAQRLNHTLDPPVDGVLQRALSKDPNERYPTCSDFTFALDLACNSCRSWRPLPAGAAQELATVVGRAETDRTPDPPAAVPGPLRFVRNASLVLAGVVAIGALLVGALRFATDRSESTAPPPVEQAQKASPAAELPGDPVEETAADETKQPEAPPPPQPSQPNQPNSAPVPSPAASAVRIVTNPAGALVIVDGSSALSCESPCSVELPPGRHTLSAAREGFRRTLRIVQTPADTELFLNLDRSTGTLVVRSEPAGAAILIDGQQRAERTPAMLTLPVGTHKIEVVGSGSRESREVMVRDSSLTNVAVTFR
jgi:serine/threonine-protein kinase